MVEEPRDDGETGGELEARLACLCTEGEEPPRHQWVFAGRNGIIRVIVHLWSPKQPGTNHSPRILASLIVNAECCTNW